MATSTPTSPLPTAAAPRLNWGLLLRFLGPWRWQVALLGGILFATIAVQLAAPIITGRFIDQATAGGAQATLVTLALAMIGLAILGQAIAIAETWVAERISWGATNALREELARHLLHLDAAFHHAHTPGALIERVDGDVGNLANFFSRLTVYVAGNALLAVGILALLFTVDWRIGLAMTLCVVLAVGAMLWLRARATPAAAAERQAAAEYFGFLGEYLSGLEDVRANGARGVVLRRAAVLLRVWRDIRIEAGMRGYALLATNQGIFGLGLVLVLGLSVIRFQQGMLSLGAVFVIYRYAEMLRGPIDQMRNELHDLQQAAASLGRIDALLAERSVVVDGPGAALPPGPLSLTFDNVWLSYEPGTPVLRGITLTLPPGRVLGVLGRTGSGKTSLTRLIPRFYDPDQGSVRLGEVDLREVSVGAIRSRLGLVTQEAQLFAASVRDNLTLFDDTIPDAALRTALAEVGLGDWLAALPAGLDTNLGTATRNGAASAGLSAGERQSLACARLLLRDPDLIILDEPSSKLDLVTERLVQRTLARVLAGPDGGRRRTGVIIAHRLATVEVADDIVILEDGRIVEHGDREALAANPASRYAALRRLAMMEVAA